MKKYQLETVYCCYFLTAYGVCRSLGGVVLYLVSCVVSLCSLCGKSECIREGVVWVCVCGDIRVNKRIDTNYPDSDTSLRWNPLIPHARHSVRMVFYIFGQVLVVGDIWRTVWQLIDVRTTTFTPNI